MTTLLKLAEILITDMLAWQEELMGIPVGMQMFLVEMS
jgi:imidazoleglycerol phosphate synthase glutamine amidotransferase subunit HisH